jgi:hypothetical protein
LAVGAFALATLAGTPPAGADTELTVEAGFAGGLYVPGRSVPVRVTITADRLVQGTVRVELGRFDDAIPVAVPVEVPGGSSKQYLVVVPSVTAGDGGKTTVTVSLDGDDAKVGRIDITASGDVDLVGLAPDLVPEPPDPLDLGPGLGTARFHQLSADELATPGALDALGTIVTAGDGLSSLSPSARSNVLDWLDRGGRLVLDGAPGDAVGGLPEAWQPEPGDTRAWTGRGGVRLVEGAVAAGRWDAVVEPTALMPIAELNGGLFFGSSDGVATTVAEDGGLRVAVLGWLLVFLVAYVVLVGPVAFLLLRRAGRSGWTWFAVPATAAVFTVAAFVIGTDLRTGNEIAHGSVVETGPAGSRAFSYLGLLSRSGADAEVGLPAGWQSSDMASPLGDWFGEAPSATGPDEVVMGADATVDRIGLDPGGFGMVTAWGPVEPTPGIEVTAVAAPDGSVHGTIHNATDATLRDILILVGVRAWGGGKLEPGEEAEWQLGPGGGLDADTWNGLPETPWRDAAGWDTGEPDPLSDVNFAVWSDWRSRQADIYPAGIVTAAGWTDDWTPPLDSGRKVSGGRTVFTTQAAVGIADRGTTPEDAVRREYLRGTAATDVQVDQDDVDEFGEVDGAVVRFTLPPGSPVDAPLELRVPGSVLRMELLVGESWTESRELAALAGRDPFDATDVVEVALPPGAVADGQVYARISYVSGVAPMWAFNVREAST